MDSDDFSALNATFNMMTALDPIITAVVTYRDRMKQEGFSAEAAERMAEEFHRMMLVKAAV